MWRRTSSAEMGPRPGVGVCHQEGAGLACVGVCDRPAQRAPPPLDAVGLWVVGGRRDQDELTPQLGQQLPKEERALGRVAAQVVQQDYGDPSAGSGTLNSALQLSTERGSPAASRPLPIQPAVTPIDQPEAVLFRVVPRRFDPALAAPSLGAPDAGQRGMQGDLDFILQVEPRFLPTQPVRSICA